MTPSPNIIRLEQATRFVAPTIEAVLLQAAKVGLPEPQAQLYFAYNEARNWMIGKSMTKNWHASLTVWRIKWQEGTSRLQQPSASMKMMRDIKELERVEQKMKDIKKMHGDSGWPYEAKLLWGTLIRRRDELKKMLNFAA